MSTTQQELVRLALYLCDLADEVDSLVWRERLRRMAGDLVDEANQPPLRPSNAARRPAPSQRRRAANRSA